LVFNDIQKWISRKIAVSTVTALEEKGQKKEPPHK